MPSRNLRSFFTFRRFLSAVACALLLAGCAAFPPSDALPPGLTIASRISVAAGSPVAWNPAGEQVAIVRDRLYLWQPDTGTAQALVDVRPVALAWSPDGARLAVVSQAGADSRLLILAASGETIREKQVSGRVASLAWTAGGELLWIAATLKEYKFGGNFSLDLYRWKPEGDPAAAPLFNTTLMPRTVRQWGETLTETAVFSAAPLGDAILFARLRDPPAFSPYLEIVQHHLATGGERTVAQVPMNAAPPLFAADSERVLFGDGRQTRLHDPWTEKDVATFPTPGRKLALSPGGEYLLADGHLYRGGERIGFFPAGEGWFAPTGNRLLLRQGSKLLVIAGLDEPPAPPLPAEAEHLSLLRRWRAAGLITHAEFLQQLAKEPPR